MLLRHFDATYDFFSNTEELRWRGCFLPKDDTQISLFFRSRRIMRYSNALRKFPPNIEPLLKKIHDISSQNLLDFLEALTRKLPPQNTWDLVIAVLIAVLEEVEFKAVERTLLGENESKTNHLKDALMSRLQFFCIRLFSHGHKKASEPTDAKVSNHQVMRYLLAERISSSIEYSPMVPLDYTVKLDPKTKYYRDITPFLKLVRDTQLRFPPSPSFAQSDPKTEGIAYRVDLLIGLVPEEVLRFCDYTRDSLKEDVRQSMLSIDIASSKLELQFDYSLFLWGSLPKKVQRLGFDLKTATPATLLFIFGHFQALCLQTLENDALRQCEHMSEDCLDQCAHAFRKVVFHLILWSSHSQMLTFIIEAVHIIKDDDPNILSVHRSWAKDGHNATILLSLFQERVILCHDIIFHQLPYLSTDATCSSPHKWTIKILSHHGFAQTEDLGEPKRDPLSGNISINI